MKKTFIVLLLFIKTIAYSQDILPRNPETQKFEFSEVVELNRTKNELYSNARTYFAKIFKNSQNVIQYQDKEEGKIVGKFTQEVFIKPMGMQTSAGHINYDIVVMVKDNKYKFIIGNIYHTNTSRKVSWKDIGELETYQPDGLSMSGPNKKQFVQIQTQIKDQIDFLVQELKKEMTAKSDDF